MEYRYFVSFYAQDGRHGWTSVTVSDSIASSEELNAIENRISEIMEERIIIMNWRRWEEPE